MAYSVAYKKSLQKTAQTLNNNGASSSSSSSSGSSSSSSSGNKSTSSKGTSSSSSTSSKYTISSDAGKSIAQGLNSGETYTASDGSTWKKESDGSVTVTESNGKVHTNAYTSSSGNKIAGVSDDIMIQLLEGKYQQSNTSSQADAERDNALNQFKDMMGSFQTPQAVVEADEWLSSQLELIQSGKTSYSDQLKETMDKIMNREKFSYDVDTDPLFQQALASAMNSGKQAMQDTIGQASALTGGYGSTYATSAGNQAYNSFIEDAYDNLPQYYQMAMEAYQMEGDEMYRQYGMLFDADATEYNRNVTAYDATYQRRNQIFNEAYTQHRDNVSDAFNYYSATADHSDSIYQREYNSWLDSINIALKQAEMQNNDYWNKSNQDFQASESQKNRDWQSEEAEKERAFTASENAKSRAASRGSSSFSGSTYKLSTTEINGLTEAYLEGGVDGAMAYLSALGKAPTDESSLDVIENILVQADSKASAEKEANTPKSGTISEFRSVNGDNFKVKVGDKTYGVENHGKVTDSSTLKELNKLNTNNGTTFLYNGEAYAKSGDGYYLIGAKMFGGKDYENLKKALQK